MGSFYTGRFSGALSGFFRYFPMGTALRPLGRKLGNRVAMDARKRIAGAIKDYLARERISRAQFAFQTRLGKSTIDKLLIGLFSDRTLSIVEHHTKLSLRALLAGETTVPAAAVRPADTPSLAVLPFASLGGEGDQEFIADGIADDLITALARLRWLTVIARNSSFVYRGRAVDLRNVARDLGVRYLLQGSVRMAGPQLRITSQLVEAEIGKQLWAEKYDRDLSDIFAVLDDITNHVVAAVEPHLYAEEGFRAACRQPDSIDAWGLVVRALGLLNRMERRQNAEAHALLERAIELEPRYARAHALLAWAKWWQTLCLWGGDSAAGYRQAAGHAHDALALDPGDPWARMSSGLCLSTAGQHERALEELGIALSLNPSFALGHMAHGWALLRAGRFDEAIAETGRALRMSPVDSFSGFYTSVHGLALLAARRFDEALPFLRASVAAFADYSGHYNTLISCCGHLGRIEEAREFLATRDRMSPPLRLGLVGQHMNGFAHREVFMEGLRKAGVSE